MKQILVVSHCILNNASKVRQDESELAEEYKVRRNLMKAVTEQDIQLLQLPCPEFMLYGSSRWGHVKDQFDNPFFRSACARMLEAVLLQLEEYCKHPEHFEVIGIVSVEGSPSCGYKLTCRGNWGGKLGSDSSKIDEVQRTLRMEESPGVFIDVMQEELASKGLDIPIVTMDKALEMLI